MFIRILIGLMFVAIGFVLVWKTDWFQVNFGSIAWAEEKLGTSGGSRLFYKLIGILFVIIGFLAITNLHEQAFVSIFGSLFNLQPADPSLQ